MSTKSKKNILIVDDEEALRDILYQELTAEGYEVDTVDGGQKVVGMLKKKSYDLLLLDINMPHMDGFAVLQQIKNENLGLKTVMLSGFDDLKNAIQATRLGAVGFISKPFRFHDVLTEVEKALAP
ncbi:MAG: response regulator [Ignavibacteriales bacterium]|nr:response regulator [Ignavibacteriales bacterium]